MAFHEDVMSGWVHVGGHRVSTVHGIHPTHENLGFPLTVGLQPDRVGTGWIHIIHPDRVGTVGLQPDRGDWRGLKTYHIPIYIRTYVHTYIYTYIHKDVHTYIL